MPCGHARRGGSGGEKRGLDRREFVKAALAIGGVNALQATRTRARSDADGGHEPISLAARRNRQHAWEEFLTANEDEQIAPPRHHLLLALDYLRGGTPTPEDRRAVAGALDQLEAAFEWSNRGLLFTVGYSTVYFDRFDEELPKGVDLREAQEVVEAVTVGDEDPIPEPYEVLIHLGSNDVGNLLAAEEALWGFPDLDREAVGGVPVEHTFEGVFEKPTAYPERRTGYVGAGLPRERTGRDDIPKESPLSMGFQSGFEDNQPAERDVTMLADQTLDGAMPPGVFAQGTVQHVSKLDLDLDGWYAQSHDERATRMFSPHHAGEVGERGEALGETTDLDDLPMRDAHAETDVARRTHHDAAEEGVVGHAQKLSRARFDLARRQNGAESDATLDPTILRRDFDTTDEGSPGLHFVSLMRFNGYFVYTRLAMNGVAFDGRDVIPPEPGESTRVIHEDVEIPREDDGFLAHVTAERRGNFLVPPIELRAFPPARAARARMTVEPEWDGRSVPPDGTVEVLVHAAEDFDPGRLNVETIRFGERAAVDEGRGARPTDGGQLIARDGSRDLRLTFHVDDAEFEGTAGRARLFGKTVALRPVVASLAVRVT